MCNLPKEMDVHRIILDALRVVEEEHGLLGLDCVAHLVEQRQRAIIAKSMKEREETVDNSPQDTDLPGQ